MQKFFQDINYHVAFHDLNNELDAITILLAGDEAEAGAVPFTGKAPGLARYSSSIVLVLYNAQYATQSVKELLANILRTRQFQDKEYNFWQIPDNVKLALVLDTAPNSETSQFDTVFSNVNIQINLDIDYSDVESIISLFCKKHNFPSVFTDDFIPAFKNLCSVFSRNLHDVEQIFQLLKTTTSPVEVLSEKHLIDATSKILTPILGALIYRGSPLNIIHFKKWQTQFSEEAQFLPSLIIRKLYEKYYISSARYFQSIRQLVTISDIPFRARVVFCKWQKIGKSSPKITNDLKTLARWGIVGEIDLDHSSESWPPRLSCQSFIVADDFVGSGDTLLSLLDDGSNFLKIFQKYHGAKVSILILVGFKNALIKFLEKLKHLGLSDKINIHCAITYDECDKSFSELSTIFDSNNKRVLLEFCTKFSQTFFKKPSDFFVHGYKGTGSLVVFEHTVPNNSLPILWVDDTDWHSLFPASGCIS